jgi:hypothetical protein
VGRRRIGRRQHHDLFAARLVTGGVCVCVCGLLELIAIPLADADSLQSPCAGDALDPPLWKILRETTSRGLCELVCRGLCGPVCLLCACLLLQDLVVCFFFVYYCRTCDEAVCGGSVSLAGTLGIPAL